LHCDDGRCLGVILRCSHGLTYAWGQAPGCSYLEHIGAMVDDQAARAAVERRLEEVGP
jgi:hypothetical protein